MTQADTVVSFPVSDRSTDFLKCAIGTPQARLGAVAERIQGLGALVSLAKRDESLGPVASGALFGIELMLEDMLGFIDAEPLR